VEAWNAWFDEGAGFDDPRYYIDHCEELVGLEPGLYYGHAEIAPLGGEVEYATDPIVFEVPSRDGRYRRPTALLGFGLDVLHVGVTRTPDQELVVRAYPYFAAPAGCPAAVAEDDGAVVPFRRVTGFVPEATLADPEYPYLLDHSVEVNHAMALQEGQRFYLCLYWLNGATVELSEQIDLSTPNGYAPELRLLGFANLVGSYTDLVVDATTPHGCLSREHVMLADLPAAESPLPFDPRSEPTFVRHEVTLCDDLRPLALADQYGITIAMGVIEASGVSHDNESIIPLALSCGRSACEPRPPEMAVVPLPDVPVERRLCGSGRGADCDSDSPMRSAGQAIFEITYDEGTRLAGYRGWVFVPGGAVDPSPDAVEVAVELRTATAALGEASASIETEISAPSPVSVHVTLRDDDGSPPCVVFDLGGAVAAGTRPDEPGTEYSMRIGGLCTGTRYLLSLAEWEPSGLPVEFVDSEGVSLAGGVDFWTWFPRMNLLATLRTDIGGSRRVVQVTPVSVTAIGTDDSVSSSLGWNPTADDFVNNLATDWRYTVDSACKLSDRDLGPLQLTAEQVVPVSSESVRVQVDVDVRRIGSSGRGGRLGTNCTPGRLDATYRIDLLTDVASLLDGVTFESSDGILTFEIAALPG
jgi:hypothetical protein